MKNQMTKRSGLFLMTMTLIVAQAHTGFGESEWMIFKKIQSTQNKAMMTTTKCDSDISGMFSNPASACTALYRDATLLSEMGSMGDSFGGFLYREPFSWGGSMTGGFVYSDAGMAEMNWVEDGELKEKSVRAQQDSLAVLSYSQHLSRRFSMGISLKAARSRLAEMFSASAYAADVGFFYAPSRTVSFSAAVQNLGRTTAFVSKESKLPSAGYFSGGITLPMGSKSFLHTAAGVTYFNKNQEMVPDIGAELGLDFVSINAGYRLEKGKYNLQAGMGIRLGKMTLGYAYIPSSELNPSHRLTVGFRFGELKPKSKNPRPQASSLSSPTIQKRTTQETVFGPQNRKPVLKNRVK